MVKLNKNKLQSFITLTILIGIAAFMTIASDKFLSPINLTNILRQVSLTVIIAVAATFVMISGGLDLSVGSVLAFSSVITAKLAATGYPVFMAVLIGVLCGGGFGFLNGILIVKTKIPPVIATLGSMYIARGLAFIVSNGVPIVNGIPSNYGFAIDVKFLGMSLMIWIMIIAFIVFYIILNKTLLGKYTYAIGGNVTTALLSGININKVKIIIYTLTGLCAGISGVLMSSRLFSGDPNIGVGFEFDVIIAIFLGGVSVSGGEGKLGGTLVGALIVAVLTNGMNLIGITSFYQYLVQGIVLVFAVVLDLTIKGKGLSLGAPKKTV